MCTALVVDASPIARMTANNALVVLDYTVREARDGAGALRLCRIRMPDLIVLDWDTPDALSWLTAIRALPAGLKPTVVVYADQDEPGQMLLAVTAGADEYISKPLERDALEAKLVQLAEYALNKELAA